METIAHGIGVKNRYALFYDEDVDPLEILKRQADEKQKRKIEKTQTKEKGKAKSGKPEPAVAGPQKPKENPTSKVTKPAPTPVADPAKNKRKPFVERTAKSAQPAPENKDVDERKNFRNRDDPFANNEVRERDSEFRRGRGGGYRGRGGRDRGRGYFGNAEGRNRRLFDRHSGSDKTGVRPVDKRDGAGPNNWGNIKTDINQTKGAWSEEEMDAGGDKTNESMNWGTEEQDGEKATEVAGKPEFGEAADAETKENDPAVTNQVEEAIKEMTLDEWKREQEAKRAVPKYNLRKPGEGEDNKKWKKLYLLKKKDKEEESAEEEEEADEEFGRKGHNRQLLSIQINFNDSRRGRGRGRGGRGARDGGKGDSWDEHARDNRNRDSGKMKGQQSAPRVDDWNDFPSLIHA